MKTSQSTPILFFAVMISLLLQACSSGQQGGTPTTPAEAVVVENAVMDEQKWVVDEHHINEVPVTSHPTAKPRVKKHTQGTIQKMEAQPAESVDYSVRSAEELHLAVKQYENIEPITIAEVQELVIPLEETQTVTAYGKKEKYEGAAMVVTNLQTGEIDHIIFDNKHHHSDYYDVHAGMKASEVRKLRREMKHLAHKGRVYFYADGSNVMYVLDIKYADGQEVTEEMIDNSFVSAVVWKDNKHPEHPQNLAQKI